jgi:hypothetical protein
MGGVYAALWLALVQIEGEQRQELPSIERRTHKHELAHIGYFEVKDAGETEHKLANLASRNVFFVAAAKRGISTKSLERNASWYSWLKAA